MKNEKQIVLFFKKGTSFNQVQLASKLNEKYSELGNPAIFPPNDKDPFQPLIIFNQSPLNLTINSREVSFMYRDDENSFDLIIKILELFEYFDLTFVRMGYISTYNHTKREKDKFKKLMFKDDNPINNDFQIAWYSKELIDSVSVNVWERHLTDVANRVEFASIFDINTPIEEEYNITSDFIKTFIKKCDKFIEEQLRNRL